MTEEDKQLIAEYIGWNIVMVGPQKSPYPIYVDNIDSNIHHRFDLNDASLCVAEMQKRGEWEYFVGDTEDTLIYTRYHKEHHSYKSFLVAWLFNAENFHNSMAAWLRSRE